jgi:glucose-1-phosphate cytidylyltransferase
MKVVILCGGRGTRLHEETEYRPKPMVPIGDYPILLHIMQRYARYGFKKFVLCLGYKGDMIKNYFRNFQWCSRDITFQLGSPQSAKFHGKVEGLDWEITLADTGQDTMTAYRIRQIERYLDKGEDFMLTYGDGLGSVDIKSLVDFHRKSGKICTLTAVHPPGRFGEIQVNSTNDVSSFNEKPQVEGPFINGGFMVCKPELFEYLPNDPSVMFEQEPIRRLVLEGQLAAYKHNGFWQPMDTYAEFVLLNKLWSTGHAPWL